MNTRNDQIEQARRLISTGISEDLKEVLEKQYPELKDSEDERIRNCIVELLRKAPQSYFVDMGTTFVECFAYLEKQKDLTRENIIKELEKEFYACATTPKWLHNAMQGAIDYGKAVASGEIKPPTVNLEKQKEQKSTEWSEEDEEMLDAMIDIVSNSLYEPLCPREGMLAWLKSLRPQPQWKPTEEQMEALFTCISVGSFGHREALKSLYNDLKKL